MVMDKRIALKEEFQLVENNWLNCFSVESIVHKKTMYAFV